MTKKKKPRNTRPGSQNKKNKRSQPHSYGKTTYTVLAFLKPLLFIAIVWILFATNTGYDRLYKQNVVNLLSDLKTYKGLSWDEKLTHFLPQDYPFLKRIKDATPANAIILAPPRPVWYPKDRDLGFGRWISRNYYLSYFLYPRRVVIDDKKNHDNPLIQQATHVMIVDSWGYDKLSYQVANPQPFTVMPIHQ